MLNKMATALPRKRVQIQIQRTVLRKQKLTQLAVDRIPYRVAGQLN